MKRTRKVIENTLLIAGLAGIGIFISSKVSEMIYQSRSNRDFEQQVQSAHTGTYRPAPIHKDDVVGRLTIPRLHMHDIVREGTGEGTLTVALGHIEGTAMPGQTGNVGIAGHRDTLFRALRQIVKNDLIQFQTVTDSYDYRVDGTSIAEPQDVEVLRASSSPELTLVTCYPFNYVGSAPKRFIVKAHQVRSGPVSAPPEVAERKAPERTAEAQNPTKMVMFQISKGHSRELAPGISFGLQAASKAGRFVSGWMWLMPDHRTIWLRNQSIHDPVVFYGGIDGTRRELRITNVTNDSVNGYLLLYRERASQRGLSATAQQSRGYRSSFTR